MKIAFTADPEIAVPPLFYGGIERIIDLLITELSKLGHEVTLFAHKDSVINGRLIPYHSTATGFSSVIRNSLLISKTTVLQDFDIIHSFGRLAYLMPLLPFRIPKLMSYQREPTLSQIKKAIKLAKKNTLAFTGCSGYISNQITPFAPAYAIYNGVDVNKYVFENEVDINAPLTFLGRIEPIKGTHIAIKVARATNRKLIIAGNIPSEYQSYFDEQIKPELDDQITYIGPVNDAEKNILLGSSAAFLMPIEWNEPFGIVMVEAMACGTPVIAFNRGSVPEVILHTINGFRCDTTEEMISYVNKIASIDRKEVRKDAESRFSAQVIVQHYLSLYKQLIERNA